MSSLARRHRERTAAAILAGVDAVMGNAAPEIDLENPAAAEYNQLLVVLEDHQRKLSSVQSVTDRNPLKREMAHDFDAWVDGVLAAGAEGAATQDLILVTMLIWAIDTGDFDRALELGGHAITHGLRLPGRFKGNAACLIAENIAAPEVAPPVPPTHAQLLATYELVKDQDMYDQAKAKLLKAIGRSWAKEAEAFDPSADDAVAGGKASMVAAALDAMDAARRLNAQVGLKKEMEKLERALADLGGRPQPQPAEGAEEDSEED